MSRRIKDVYVRGVNSLVDQLPYVPDLSDLMKKDYHETEEEFNLRKQLSEHIMLTLEVKPMVAYISARFLINKYWLNVGYQEEVEMILDNLLSIL